VLAKTYKGNDTITGADVVNANVQYLYSDATSSFFMNGDTYETYEVSNEIVGDQIKFLVEGSTAQAQSFNGNVINVELPKNVFLKVTHAENAVKGDTSSSITKDATVETGLNVKVPAFIKTGDIISVDTTTGIYRERKKD
jgi:elongation factor P